MNIKVKIQSISDDPFYEGYSVSIKEGVEKTDKLQKAVDAIRSLDTIFNIDYICN